MDRCHHPGSFFAVEYEMLSMEKKMSQQWVCAVCGYVHEGETPPEFCPICGAGSGDFAAEASDTPSETATASSSEYLSEWARKTDDVEESFARITAMAKTGKSESAPMRTQKAFPDFESILFKGAQLFRMPLNEDETVDTTTVIGKSAAQPLKLDVPFYVSHMSFGALSREAKIALAKGSQIAGTAIASGEGGLLPVECDEAGRYIYELGTAGFSRKEAAVKQADAVEIKIGQAAKPGIGGHLPGEKVTEEIAGIRGLAPGQDSISPARPAGISSIDDLRALVDQVRAWANGKPLGIKISAGHLEQDLKCVLSLQPDFVTLDCRGGGTGSAPTHVKDNVCLPAVFAIRRARKFLDKNQSAVTLCVTGGFRTSADIAKALALGADAVALATASMIAIGCQQYRICNTGKCPVGIATQDEELRKRLNVDESARQFVNFATAMQRELSDLARINGRADIHQLDRSDIFTIDANIAQFTDIEHA